MDKVNVLIMIMLIVLVLCRALSCFLEERMDENENR